MTTGLERITAKARENASLQFTSLAHHISKELNLGLFTTHLPNEQHRE